MLIKTLVFSLCGIFLIRGACWGQIVFDRENFIFSIDSYFRTDCVTFNNTVDLDSGNKDDKTAYLGIDYSLAFKSEFKNEGAKFYLKLERNGPGDYDAPLFVHNTLQTSGGAISRYRDEELLPGVEEFWTDIPVRDYFRFKIGLYAYEVGNSLSLNGSFENYGLSLYKKSDNFSWRIYYCRPDAVYKNPLGKRIPQEEEQGYVYAHNLSNFFAADVNFHIGKNILQPYVGALVDYTSQDKRDNDFSAPTEKDILGTAGLAWSLEKDNFIYKAEAAHNFGKAVSSDPEYKDVEHRGYLVYTDVKYKLGKFVPALQFILCSGNKVTPEMALDGVETLTSGKNRAFSVSSPLNDNLSDSVSHNNSEMRPIVAMGSGYGLNYGVMRPGTFSASDFENLIMPALGLDFNATEKLWVGLYGYYLNSFERPVGTLNGEGRYLSRELGREIDLLVDYRLNDNILLSFVSGYFAPGEYYRESRTKRLCG